MKWLQHRWPGPALVVLGLLVIGAWWFEPVLRAVGVLLTVIGVGLAFKRFGARAIGLLLLVWVAYFGRAWLGYEWERSAPRRTSDADYVSAPRGLAHVERVDQEMLLATPHALTGQINYCVSVTIDNRPARRCDLSEAFWETLKSKTEWAVRYLPRESGEIFGFRFEDELTP